MSSQSTSQTNTSTIGNRAWYGLITLFLLVFSMTPWFNGIAPGLAPVRFFRSLPFPAVNILFALYVGAILLYGWMAITWSTSLRHVWYRFWLALASFVMFLIMAESSGAGWGVAAAGLILITAAFAELVFLFSK